MITINVIFSFDEASVVELYLIETIDKVSTIDNYIQGVKERNICTLRIYRIYKNKQKCHNQYLKCFNISIFHIYLLYIKNTINSIFILLKLYQHEIII